MRKLILSFLTISLLITACSSNEEEFAGNTTVTINFTHVWDSLTVTKEDFNDLKYVNENGETLSIEKLRYLISDIYLENESGVTTDITDYLLVNLGDEENLTFSTENLLLDGTYDVYFRFGFSDEDNYVEEGYLDLNTEIFNVPDALGGGYHYMQFDGKYINESDVETGFNYHTIRATNVVTKTEEEELTETDTSFEVDLGEVEIENSTVTIDVQMDIAEWFVNTNIWNLNELDQVLMPNYEAQIMMNENGATVFSLIEEEEED